MPTNFLEKLSVKSEISVDAPPTTAVNIAEVDGVPHVFLANFSGLIPSKVAQPTPMPDIHVRIPAAMGNSLVFLPFLGNQQFVKGTRIGEQTDFALPTVERGAVVWVQRQ